MKNFLAVLLILAVLIGCSETGDPESDDTVKVALLVGNLGDLSFNDSANEGLIRAAQDFENVELKVLEYSDDPNKYEPTFLEAAEGDYDLIIFSSSLQTIVEEHSADFPEKTFVIFDAEVDYSDGKNTNVYSIVYKANEASYLGGYLAAKLSDTGVLGFLGGQDLPVISDFLVGFIQGAQEADPDVKVATTYVGSWSDPAKGKEQSLAMINQNASLIFGVAGGSGVGAIEAGAEEGISVLGVDSDQALIYEQDGNLTYAETIISSVLKNVGNSLYRAVELYLSDELKVGEVETLGIAEGGVGLADNKFYQAAVSAELRSEIEALEAKVVSGDITITSAYGLTTEEINEIRNSVRP